MWAICALHWALWEREKPPDEEEWLQHAPPFPCLAHYPCLWNQLTISDESWVIWTAFVIRALVVHLEGIVDGPKQHL